MPEIKVLNMNGAEVGTLALSDKVFGAEINEAVLHAAVRAYLLNQRHGTQSTLTRSEVSGGGRKPWRQKGTGRARQGSTRSPQWTHGGIALGPKPRSYTTKLNKKVKQIALFSALSAKVAENEMIVIDAITATEYKTKTMVAMLGAIGAGKKSLVVLEAPDAMVVKSLANIPGVKVAYTNTLNVYDILNCDSIVFAKNAVAKLEEVYA
ncbi:MAG: 50S ribosomal protein L4 [Clostridia bacterium]|nr:50S ribosomal protein L4 [Clostridia bacterium]MBR2296195.1 50S ribosomal protein L4 [Clostridia bacterium]